MHVYSRTHVDRDLLLAGADLEAVLADREKPRLERNERTEARLSAAAMARLGHHAPRSSEDDDGASRPPSA